MASFVVSTMALKRGLGVESITELADILTNPFHDDNAKTAKKVLRHNYEIVSEGQIISDQIRGNYTKESTAKHQTPETVSRRIYVPTPSRHRSLRPYFLLFRRAFMLAGAVLAFLSSKHVPGSAPPNNSHNSHSTILSWLLSGTVAKPI